MTVDAARYVSIAAAAQYIGVSPDTIRRRISDGTLRAFRFGPRQIRIAKNDLDALFRPMPTASRRATA